jgi:hypothetical protein
MMPARIATFGIVAAAIGIVSGCQYVGPIAIDQGRDRYNGIIQATSKQQTFSNIIRVRNHEPTSFMDVSEVDASTTLSGNVTGAITNIGATATKSTTAGTLAGQVGSVGGGAVYTEQPLIRYTPLLGQALVAQLVTPVSVDVLDDLFQSGWNATALLHLATAYLSLHTDELYEALNVISELDAHKAIELVATKSDLSKEETPKEGGQVGTLQISTKPSTGGGSNDSLTIYLNPMHAPGYWQEVQLWMHLLWLYAGTQPPFADTDKCKKYNVSVSNESLLGNWNAYVDFRKQGLTPNEVLQCLPSSVELRNKAVTAKKMQDQHLVSGAPLIKTYSALGILKTATETPGPKVAFVNSERFREVRGHPWNSGPRVEFYTLLPQDEGPHDNPPWGQDPSREKLDQEIASWINANYSGGLFLYTAKQGVQPALNRRLGELRRYMLIIMDDHPPANAYVEYFDKGTWYYIDADDGISQKNFNLIGLFLTMMAVPSALPPISPTITVGGSGG